MERGFNKIVIVSLSDKFSQEIGEKLSHELDMMHCDSQDLLEYELIDGEKLKQFCTQEYLEFSEKRVFSHISTFENVVVTISFDNLIKHIDLFKENSAIVFLKLQREEIKEEKINFIAYESRTKQLQDLSTVTIDIQNTQKENVCDKILSALGGIL